MEIAGFLIILTFVFIAIGKVSILTGLVFILIVLGIEYYSKN